jgi:hypothetical protein
MRMASPLSDALKKAVIKRVEQEEGAIKNRVEIAMERTEERVAQKIQEIIDIDAIDFFYKGYNPSVYVRTNQLRDSGAIAPYINEFKKNGYVGFQYGAVFDETLMDHSWYEILRTWTNKDGTKKEKYYKVHNEEVDEKAILDLFRAGIHKRALVQGDIWMSGMIGCAPDVLRQWKDSGAILKIFKEEFDKLKK